MKIRVSLILLPLVFAAQASAQSDEQSVNVSVYHSGDDPVGRRLVYQFREQIRRSEGLNLNQEAIYIISFVTLASDGQDELAGTTYSMTLTIRLPDSMWGPATTERFIHSVVGFCGSQRVAETAQNVVAIVDGEINEFKQAMKVFLDSQREQPD